MKMGEAFYKLARFPAQLFFLVYAIFLIGLMLSSFYANAVLALFVYLFGLGFLLSINVWRYPVLNVLGGASLAALTALIYYVAVGVSASVFPGDLQILIVAVGTLAITGIAGLGALVGLPFRRFRPHLKQLDKEEKIRKQALAHQHERHKSRFSERMKELTTVILLAFTIQFVGVPFLQSVTAAEGEELTTEEFIKTYDPEAEYETRGEPVDQPPKQRIPLDPETNGNSGTAPEPLTPEQLAELYPNLTKEELENLLLQCNLQGCSQQELKELLVQKNMESEVLFEQQKRIETLKQLNLNAEMLLQLYEKGEISTQEFAELAGTGLEKGLIKTSDLFRYEKLAAIAGAFLEKYPILAWAFEKLQPFIAFVFPSIGILIDAYKLDKAHGSTVTRTIGAAYNSALRMTEDAATFIRENPESLGVVVGIGVVAGVAAVLTLPVCGGCGGAAVLWTVGALGTFFTAATLGIAYADGGTDGVLKEIFSDEVLDAIARGNFAEIVGGGSMELVAFVFMNLPQNPAKIGQVFGALNSLRAFDTGGDVARLIQSLRNAKQAFAAIQQAGKISDAGMQFLGLLIKEQAMKGAYAVDDFLTFLTEPGALTRNYAYLGVDESLVANLNKQGERMQNLQELGYDVENAKQVVGAEWDGLMSMVGGGSVTSTKVVDGVMWRIRTSAHKNHVPDSSYIISNNKLSSNPSKAIENGSLPYPTKDTKLTANQLVELENYHARSHPASKHVGRTEAQLKARVAAPDEPNMASTFTSFHEYVDSVNEVYAKNHNEIKNFLSDANATKLVISSDGSNTSKGFKVDTSGSTIANDIIIVFTKNDSGQYFLTTNYVK